MRFFIGLAVPVALLSSLATAAHANPPLVEPPPHVTPTFVPPRRVATTVPTTHAPAVVVPVAEAPRAAPIPSSLHLTPASTGPVAAPPSVAAPKASPQLVDFVKQSWTTKAPSLNYKPYRLPLTGESLPPAVEHARGEGGAGVFVVSRGADQTEKRLVSVGGGRFSETEVKVPGPDLAPSNRLYIVRRNFTTTLFDADGQVVASGSDRTPGEGGDFMHNRSTEWNGRPTGVTAPAQSLPVRNPGVLPSGGGSFAFTVPLAGTTMRVATHDAGAFFEGGAETTEADWGGRLIVPQPYVHLLNGQSLWVAPKVVNVKPIVDARTGKPVESTMALDVGGREARYEPRSRSDARPDLSVDDFRRLYRGPGPLF